MALPIAGAAAPGAGAGMSSLLAGGAPPGADAAAQQAQGQQAISQVRQIGDLVQQLAGANPTVGQEVQQITNLLKAIVVKLTAPLPQQTMSGAMTPGGSM